MLADHMQLSEELQEQWNEDGNGKAHSAENIVKSIYSST